MNSPEISYQRHVQDMYGITEATIPEVEPEALKGMTEHLRAVVNPLRMQRRWKKEVGIWKGRLHQLEDVRLGPRYSGMVRPGQSVQREAVRKIPQAERALREAERNYEHWTRESEPVDGQVLEAVEPLAEALGLENNLDIGTPENPDLENIGKLLMTAHRVMLYKTNGRP
ncbi:hypothetical protein ACFL1B_02085 [Nanoarchaeota archaeon]